MSKEQGGPPQGSMDTQTGSYQALVAKQFVRFADFVEQFRSRISLRGVYVEAPSPWPVGTTVDLEFKLEDGFLLFQAVGEVAWLVEEPGGPGSPSGVAIRFQALDPKGRDLLLKVLEEQLKAGGKPFEIENPPAGAVTQPPPGQAMDEQDKPASPTEGAEFSDDLAELTGVHLRLPVPMSEDALAADSLAASSLAADAPATEAPTAGSSATAQDVGLGAVPAVTPPGDFSPPQWPEAEPTWLNEASAETPGPSPGGIAADAASVADSAAPGALTSDDAGEQGTLDLQFLETPQIDFDAPELPGSSETDLLSLESVMPGVAGMVGAEAPGSAGSAPSSPAFDAPEEAAAGFEPMAATDEGAELAALGSSAAGNPTVEIPGLGTAGGDTAQPLGVPSHADPAQASPAHIAPAFGSAGEGAGDPDVEATAAALRRPSGLPPLASAEVSGQAQGEPASPSFAAPTPLAAGPEIPDVGMPGASTTPASAELSGQGSGVGFFGAPIDDSRHSDEAAAQPVPGDVALASSDAPDMPDSSLDGQVPEEEDPYREWISDTKPRRGPLATLARPMVWLPLLLLAIGTGVFLARDTVLPLLGLARSEPGSVSRVGSRPRPTTTAESSEGAVAGEGQPDAESGGGEGVADGAERTEDEQSPAGESVAAASSEDSPTATSGEPTADVRASAGDGGPARQPSRSDRARRDGASSDAEGSADRPGSQSSSTPAANPRAGSATDRSASTSPSTPRTAAGTTATSSSATRVQRITWREVGPELVVEIFFDGSMSSGRVRALRLDGGQPRELVVLRGIEFDYYPNALRVGDQRIARIRVGHHPKQAGSELHVVFDLASGQVARPTVQAQADRLVLSFSR